MKLFREILNGVNQSELFLGARCDFFPLGGGYFQGVKALGELSNERIVVAFKRAQLEVVGVNLKVGKYLEGDLLLLGEIHAIRVLEDTVRV